jgi:hypothetical protein
MNMNIIYITTDSWVGKVPGIVGILTSLARKSRSGEKGSIKLKCVIVNICNLWRTRILMVPDYR